jgi:hypothetical protein
MPPPRKAASAVPVVQPSKTRKPAPSPQPTPNGKKKQGKLSAKVSRKEPAQAAPAPHPETAPAAPAQQPSSPPHRQASPEASPEAQPKALNFVRKKSLSQGGSSDTTTDDVPAAASGYVVYLRQHVPYSHLMHPCTIVDGLPYLVMQSMIVLERHHDDLILKSGFIYSTNHGPVYMQAIIGYVGGHHVRRSWR